MSRRYNVAHMPTLSNGLSGQVVSVDAYRAGIARSAAKYGNQKTVVSGRVFDSKLEATRFQQLETLRQAGVIRLLLCQVPFWIAPGVRYVVDFLYHTTDRDVILEDVKGVLTPTSRTKIKTVEHLYGVRVLILNRKDIIR